MAERWYDFGIYELRSEDGSCLVCQRPKSEKPMVFKNDPFCSDHCRKVLSGELTPSKKELTTMRRDIVEVLGYL